MLPARRRRLPRELQGSPSARRLAGGRSWGSLLRGVATVALSVSAPSGGGGGCGFLFASAFTPAAPLGGRVPACLKSTATPRASVSLSSDLITGATARAPARELAQSIGGRSPREEGEEWRPAGLPRLSRHELSLLHRGERVQRQTRDGGSGVGLSVVDVKADIDLVMEYLKDYKGYEREIDTVRSATVLAFSGPDTAKAEFLVSRFRLTIHVLMRHLVGRNCVEFELDPECTKLGRNVLREAKGFWFAEEPQDRAQGYTRVWMTAQVDCSRLLPGFIIDYAAARALPRATTWLKPALESAQRRRIRDARHWQQGQQQQ